jgi:hypothetical protein
VAGNVEATEAAGTTEKKRKKVWVVVDPVMVLHPA